MMIFLSILGLVGTGLATGGQIAKGYHEAGLTEEAAQAEREKIPALQAQLATLQAARADIEADKVAAAELAGIEQGALTAKGLQTAYAGRAAKGSAVAGAAAGNLGGASPLRQTQRIQRELQQQMGGIAGERQASSLRAEDAQRELETRSLATEAQILGTQYDIRWAGRRAGRQEDEADYLRSMGFLLGAGELLGGIGRTFGG